MLKKRVILTAVSVILFFIKGLYAQEDDVLNPSVYTPTNYLFENSNLSSLSSLNRNMCLSFLNDTTGRSDVKFKSVTQTTYASPDSLLEHKKLKSKTVTKYNKHGQVISYIGTDTIGKVTDSAIAFYDSLYHPIAARSFSYNDATHKLAIEFEIRNEFNAKGNCVKMESHSYKKSYGDFDVPDNMGGYDTTFTVSYCTYNSNEKMVKFLTIENMQDTTLLNYTYDANGKFSTLSGYRITHYKSPAGGYLSPRKNYSLEGYFVKMDENGNLVQVVEITGKDTEKNIYYDYDERNRETYYAEYNKGKLVDKRTTLYGLEESHTKTEDEYGTTGGDDYSNGEGDEGDETTSSTVCATDTKIISVYNRYGRLESKTTTITGSGKPSVNSIKHKLVYNRFDKVESDSMTEVEESEFHSSGTLTVYYYKYDDRGNRLEAIQKGGSGTSADDRSTYTWNEQNNLLSENIYGSCLDIPYSTYLLSYYPDGVTEKEMDIIRSRSRYIYKFGPITEKLETNYISSYSSDQTVYEYEKW